MQASARSKNSQRGASLLEYALLLALILAIAIPAVSFAGRQMRQTFVDTKGELSGQAVIVISLRPETGDFRNGDGRRVLNRVRGGCFSVR